MDVDWLAQHLASAVVWSWPMPPHVYILKLVPCHFLTCMGTKPLILVLASTKVGGNEQGVQGGSGRPYSVVMDRVR